MMLTLNIIENKLGPRCMLNYVINSTAIKQFELSVLFTPFRTCAFNLLVAGKSITCILVCFGELKSGRDHLQNSFVS